MKDHHRPPDDHEWTEDVRLSTQGMLQPVRPQTAPGQYHPAKGSDSAGRWLAVLGCILVMGLVVVLVLMTGRDKTPPPQARQVPLPPTDPVVQVREARAVALAFVTTKDWRAALPWVLDSAGVGPMMRDYYDHQRMAMPGAATRVDEGKPVVADGRVRCVFNLRSPDGTTTPLWLEWTAVGFRVDWLSFSAYGTMAWDRLLAEKPIYPADLRVFLCPAPAGSGVPVADAPPLWVRFRLAHRDFPETLDIWVRNEPLLGKVRAMVARSERTPVFVQVRFEEWNGRRFAVLDAIHHENWSR